MGKKLLRSIKWSVGLVLLILFIVFLLPIFDYESFAKLYITLLDHPYWLILIIAGYTIAFLLRALSWQLWINRRISFNVFLSGVFYSLFFNHILPFKGGEAIRIGALAQHPEANWGEAIKSVVSLRALDLLWLCLFAITGAGLIGIKLDYLFVSIMFLVVLLFVSLVAILHRKKLLPFIIGKQLSEFRKLFGSVAGFVIVILSGVSWLIEGIVVYGVARFVATSFTFFDAIWITSLSVGAGVFQLAPGGLATYESVMSFSLYQIGITMEEALSIAIITHSFKYLYSFAAGGLAFYMYPLKLSKLKSFLSKKGETR